MDFTELIAYIKQAGKKVLTFFPSKTDLISVVNKDGNVTEELLSERLENTEILLGALIQYILPWETLTAEKSGYLGSTQNKYGISYGSFESENIYWLLLQNGAVIEYNYHGYMYKPDAKLLYGEFPSGYTLCGYKNNGMPYAMGYIYYASDSETKECPNIGVIKKSDLFLFKEGM